MPKKRDTKSDTSSLSSDRELIQLREENARIKKECEALRGDVNQLDDIVGQLIRGADGMIRSRRWKLGLFLGSLKYRLLFRPVPTLPSDYIRKVKARYDEWLSKAEQPALLSRIQPAKPLSSNKKPKLTVISGDVANNSLGRAYLLAEPLVENFNVEIIGPVHSMGSEQIWEPLKNPRLPINYFEGDGENYCRYFNILKNISDRIDSDIIYISKPRMPSIILGALVKSKKNIPIVLDIDDYELSFFSNRPPISLEKIKSLCGKEELNYLCGETWARYAESLVKHFDNVTVSNKELQKKYGGTIIPHLRDETQFDPSRFGNRSEIRSKFGYKDSDKVILFVGTPRRHKGLVDIIRALDELGDPSYSLCIIGTVTDEKLQGLLKDNPNVKIIGNKSFFDLPYYLQLADLICILQDPSSPVSHYQMPAKFTDALSMGIPVIAYDVPPLRPYHEAGLVEFVKRESLPEKLVEVFNNYENFKNRAVGNIEFFKKEFSYESGRHKLTQIFDVAIKDNKPLNDEFKELFEFIADSCATPM